MYSDPKPQADTSEAGKWPEALLLLARLGEACERFGVVGIWIIRLSGLMVYGFRLRAFGQYQLEISVFQSLHILVCRVLVLVIVLMGMLTLTIYKIMAEGVFL